MSRKEEANVDAASQDEAGAAAEGAVAEAAPFKMTLQVDIQNVGPCKRHVNVKIPRADIDHYFNQTVGELVSSAVVPGFRPGHVPRKLVERRFRKEVADQIKQKILVDSLEQLAAENDLDAINEPNLRVETLQIPEEGDFEYEFDVEVRPEFELPDYKGLKIDRPVWTVSDKDVEEYLGKFLAQFESLTPSTEPAAAGDVIVASLVFKHGEETLGHLSNQRIRIKPVLRFQDAEVAEFDKLVIGAKPGDTREAETKVSMESSRIELRGENVKILFNISEVLHPVRPELTKEFLQTIGVESEEELRAEVRKVLERQVTFEQRQSARRQVLEKITESADWDLPESLVRRQVENALRREILEMQQAGFTQQQIQARENELRQNSVTTTRQALKEHFVLDRIATEEELEVTPADIETEIGLMAMQRGESPRRVRARLEKQGMIENLQAQILERKAIDVVLDRAEYKDVPKDRPESDDVEAIAHAGGGADAAAEDETPAGEES